MNKTIQVADKIVKTQDPNTTRYGIKCEKYMNPESISKNINNKLRDEKDKDMPLWDELLVKARYDMPSASEQKIAAVVFKQIQEIKNGKEETHDPELTLKPDITLSMSSKPPAPVKPKKRGGRSFVHQSSNNSKSVMKDGLNTGSVGVSQKSKHS